MTGSSEPAKRRRGPGRPFPPGTSGNPSGLPAGVPAQVAEVRRLLLVHAPWCVERLRQLAEDDDPRVALEANKAMLDRAGVAPRAFEPERVEVTHTVDVDALRNALQARLEAIAAAGEVQVPPALPDAPAASEEVVEVDE